MATQPPSIVQQIGAWVLLLLITVGVVAFVSVVIEAISK